MVSLNLKHWYSGHKMNRQLCTLLYSKYSQSSKRLCDKIQNSQVNIPIRFVCIDHKDIRKRIQMASNIKITSVPTILVVYDSGTVEKYDGGKASEWVDQEISSLLPPPPPPPPEPEPEPEPESDSEPEPEPKKSKKSKKKYTEIASIDSDAEEEDEEEYNIPKPPVGIRQGAGNYDVSNDFGKTEEKNTVQKSSIGGGGDLMAMAQAMQKEREEPAARR